MGFVVAGEAAVIHEPAECPLDDPAPGDYLEALLARVAVGDFDVEGGAVVDGFGSIAAVGPRLGDSGVGLGDAREQVDPAGIVGDAGRGDADREEEAEGVDADMALAARDLLLK